MKFTNKDFLDEILPRGGSMTKRILVVDDEKDWAHAFALALEEHGYKITAAFEPLQAITQIKESKPDLILLDLLMPAGGGFAVLQYIRETGNTIILPVIIVSVQDDDETKKKAQEHHEKLKVHIKKHNTSKGYMEFISLSKQIEFLKSSQEKAFKMFIDLKNRFVALNKLLKYKLFEERKVKDRFEEKQEKAKAKEEELLNKKYKEVEEKLKTKKKLTTEDLLSIRK